MSAGAGTTGDIELAQQGLDRLEVPVGSLAERVLTLIGRIANADARACCTQERPHLVVRYDEGPHWVARRAKRLGSGVVVWERAPGVPR